MYEKFKTKLLRGIGFVQVLSTKIKYDQNRFIELTHYQSELFRRIVSNKNIITSGPAGSGKTIVAKTIAQDFLNDGKTVLFLCFNRTIANKLRYEFDRFPQNLERSLPLTTTSLRRNYRLRGALAAGGLNLRAIERGTRSDDPLPTRLPRIECMVAPSAQQLTPALRDELALGQSFRIEDDDFEGFAIRLVTSTDSVAVRLRVRIWERPGTEFNSLLDATSLNLVASRSTPMHWIPFPVADTAGRDLALVIETMGTPHADVRLAWHENAGEDGLGDVYPYGSALLDLTPVDADLIILIY